MSHTVPQESARYAEAQLKGMSASIGEVDSNSGIEEAGISQRAVEIGVALILFALAALVVWDNQRIGAGWSPTGPESGYFPMRLGIILSVCAIAVFFQSVRSKSSEMFVSWLQLKRVSQVLIPLTIYIALIGPLGIYVASTLFITAFMMFAGSYPIWKALLVSSISNLLIFWIFEIQFKVPLPKGLLEAWLGY